MNASVQNTTSSSSLFSSSTDMNSTLNISSLGTNTTVLNISEEERRRYLQELQDAEMIPMIPTFTYLALLAVVGFIGNSLVLFVYSRKFRRTSTRIFIIAIAGFDLVSNCVVIPAEIYDLFHLWDFDHPYLCKIRLFFNASTTMASAMILVAVAVARYRKICKPFKKQISIKMAKMISVGMAILALLYAIPFAILFGRQTIKTPRPDIDGYQCAFDDSFVDTIWPLVNHGFSVLLFISLVTPLVIVYILIGITAYRHSKLYGVGAASKGGPNSSTLASSNSAGTHTKSTEDAAATISKSSRTKSYIKKKKEGDDKSTHGKSDADADEDGKSKGKKSGKTKNNNSHENNAISRGVSVSSDPVKHDDDDVIEYVNDDDDGKKKSNDKNFSAKMVRSPTGERVEVNLSMVRELTVKLKAVQKAAEQRQEEPYSDDNDDDEGKNKGNDAQTRNRVQSSSDELEHTEDDNLLKSKQNDKTQANSKHLEKTKVTFTESTKSGSTDKPDKPCKSTSSDIKKAKNSTKDSSIKNCKDSIDAKEGTCRNQGQENNNTNNGQNNSNGPSKEEPMSEFAKTMLWVDITYCLKEEGKQTEALGSKDAKKGSTSSNNKLSRDNSFQMAQKKLRDALTETFSRRKKKRDSENGAGDDGDSPNNSTKSTTREISTIEVKENPTNDTKNKPDSTESQNKNSKPGGSSKDANADESGNDIQNKCHKVRGRIMSRTTYMLLTISAVYIISFLPYLALMGAKAALPDTFASMGDVALAFYTLFVRSYFLNCAANPVVYSLLDVNFRRACLELLPCCRG